MHLVQGNNILLPTRPRETSFEQLMTLASRGTPHNPVGVVYLCLEVPTPGKLNTPGEEAQAGSSHTLK